MTQLLSIIICGAHKNTCKKIILNVEPRKDIANVWHTQGNTHFFSHFFSHIYFILTVAPFCGLLWHQRHLAMLSLLTFESAMCRIQTLSMLHPHWVPTSQALQIHYLSQLLSKILASKVVNEWIKAAIQAAETERQFVGHVERLTIEESHHSMTQ